MTCLWCGALNPCFADNYIPGKDDEPHMHSPICVMCRLGDPPAHRTAERVT